MSIFDTLRQQVAGLDLEAIGRQVGLSPEQVETGAGALLPHVADPNVDNAQATQQVAAQTGIPHGALAALIPAIMAHARGLPGAADSGALGQLLAGIRQPDSASQGGIFGSISHALDRDGDGNPLNL